MRAGFIVREIFSGLRRNIGMVISIVLVTFLSLTFVGTAGLLQAQIGQMKTYWYDKAQVAVYLCTDTSPSDACPQGEASPDVKSSVESKLNEPTLQKFVAKYYFEDHQAAYEKFQEQFKGNSVAKYVKASQLNETFWVKLKDPKTSAVIAETFNGVAGVEEVRDQRSYLDQIFGILNVASIVAVSIASIMLASAALLISTTIRLSAFSRRREIGIMRLVGASNFSIQLPFVLEGVVAATAGSLLACGALFALLQFFVKGFLAERLPLTSFVGFSDLAVIAPLIVGSGVLLAALASTFAIRRYLKI